MHTSLTASKTSAGDQRTDRRSDSSCPMRKYSEPEIEPMFEKLTIFIHSQDWDTGLLSLTSRRSLSFEFDHFG
jgi:hypothetical protein